MVSIAKKDTSGSLSEKEEEQEVLCKRTAYSKTFRLPDSPGGERRYRIGASGTKVHYTLDPHDKEGVKGYLEIDLDVELTPNEEWVAECKDNSYITRFFADTYKADYLRAGKWFSMSPVALKWINDDGEEEIVSTPIPRKEIIIDNEKNEVIWENVFGEGIDYGYSLNQNIFFKFFKIKDKQYIPNCNIGTNGLQLAIEMAFDWDGVPGLIVPDGETDSDVLTQMGIDSISFKDDEDREVFLLQPPQAWDSWIEGECPPHDCENCNKICLRYNTDDNQRLYPTISESDQRFMDAYPDAWEYRENGKPYMSYPSPLLDENNNWNVDEDKIPIKSFKGQWKCDPICVVEYYYATGNPSQEHIDGSWATWVYDNLKRENHEKIIPKWSIKRNGSDFYSKIGILKEDLDNKFTTYPVYVDVAISEEQVSSGSDDSYITSAGGWGGTATVIIIGDAINVECSAWQRFTSIPIPAGVTIDSASVSMKSSTTNAAPVTSLIVVEDTGDATQFINATAYNSASWTTGISWEIDPWTVNTWYETPDISSEIQAINDRVDWTENNSIGISMQSAAEHAKNVNRQYYSYENTAGGIADVAKFNCSYTESGGGSAISDKNRTIMVS